jgi:hypothetical protein
VGCGDARARNFTPYGQDGVTRRDHLWSVSDARGWALASFAFGRGSPSRHAPRLENQRHWYAPIFGARRRY